MCRLALGAVFCFAAAYKVVEFSAFETVLRRTNLVRELPEVLQATVGGALLGLEALLGIALLLGVRRRLVGWSTFALLVLLTGIFAVSQRSIQDTCGCMWRLGGIIPDSGGG
ncbi:MAG: MauE/DoxX family redox-associated membrane protein [Candidatus Limnocylindrus sp.]